MRVSHNQARYSVQKRKVRICGSRGNRKISDFYPALSKLDRHLLYSDALDADFLFVTNQPKSVREMFSISDRGQIRVFLGLEAQSPDMNLFDYAITFDGDVSSDRTFRPHTLLAFERFLRDGDLNFGQTICPESFLNRPGFCDFIYANKRAHPKRDKIFDELNSRFGGVSSFGTHLRNASFRDLGMVPSSSRSGWLHEKVEAQRHHKFSIAAENAHFSGYTTEKLLTPLMAGSIPIYWGNPKVGQEFNVRRFIDFSGDNFDDLEETIKTLLESPDELVTIIREPALTFDQIKNLEQNRQNFLQWFEKLLTEEKADLQRRPRGWFPDWYSGMMQAAYTRQKFSRARLAGIWRTIRSDSRG